MVMVVTPVQYLVGCWRKNKSYLEVQKICNVSETPYSYQLKQYLVSQSVSSLTSTHRGLFPEDVNCGDYVVILLICDMQYKKVWQLKFFEYFINDSDRQIL